jgi:formylglycine-generating enzyme required for sulfatase activity
MAKLFISYRRKAWPLARSVVDGLQARLNAEIFVDVDGITDDDFEVSLLGNLATSDAVLLIVSPETFDAERINEVGDWIRREIGKALELNKPILMAGMNGLTPPPADQLPAEIRKITEKEVIPIYSEFFEEGVNKIVTLLTQIAPLETRAAMLQRRQRQRRRVIGGLVILLAVLLALSYVAINVLQIVPKTTVALKTIPAGCFHMGSSAAQVSAALELAKAYNETTPADQYKFEQPDHQVCVSAFKIAESEVTNADYQRFIDAGGYATRTLWTDEGWRWLQLNKDRAPNLTPGCRVASQTPQQPRVCVNFFEAQAYAKWVSGRLPTEAEWEYVARGTEGRIYPWGNEFDSQRLNYCDRNCLAPVHDPHTDGVIFTAPVCSYPSGNSAFGVCDLAGNVWEWVADYYQPDFYQPSKSDDPTGPTTGISRVIRGGAYDNLPSVVRTTFRSADAPETQSPSLGFRIVIK